MQIARADVNDDGYEQWVKTSIRHNWHKLTDQEIGAIEDAAMYFFSPLGRNMD